MRVRVHFTGVAINSESFHLCKLDRMFKSQGIYDSVGLHQYMNITPRTSQDVISAANSMDWEEFTLTYLSLMHSQLIVSSPDFLRRFRLVLAGWCAVVLKPDQEILAVASAAAMIPVIRNVVGLILSTNFSLYEVQRNSIRGKTLWMKLDIEVNVMREVLKIIWSDKSKI